jgi:16S rRNA (cytosine967-C5)-methyltransferase
MNISPARVAAFEILRKIELERAFSSVLLPLYEQRLSVKDRALCHNLTLGVLRKQIYLDKIIDFLVGKKLDSAVRIILRIGLYQLLFLDKIPAYSAINESVNLVQKAKKTSAKGLVNAVLRRATREKIALNYTDEIERITVETSHPHWLIEKWREQFGLEEAEKIARANNETPNTVFRLTCKSDDDTLLILKKLGLEIAESEFVANAWKISSGSNEILRAYADDGKIYFQDEASQIVGQTVQIKDGESFLDVCAAPGSKTTQIANRNLSTENLQIAGDFYDHRVRTLKANCFRQGATSVNIVCYDAEQSLPFADEAFDCILIDAPCSGTGTIRHNPEIRYFLGAEDFEHLAAKQLKILQNASKNLKTNGSLVYSTCSMEREENEAVIEKFIAANDNFTKAAPNVAKQFLTAENYARTFPQRDETDGFFIAELIKNRS